METSSTEVEKDTYINILTGNNCEVSPELEVKMKMQAEGLYFIKVQKSPDENWDEQKLMNKG